MKWLLTGHHWLPASTRLVCIVAAARRLIRKQPGKNASGAWRRPKRATQTWEHEGGADASCSSVRMRFGQGRGAPLLTPAAAAVRVHACNHTGIGLQLGRTSSTKRRALLSPGVHMGGEPTREWRLATTTKCRWPCGHSMPGAASFQVPHQPPKHAPSKPKWARVRTCACVCARAHPELPARTAMAACCRPLHHRRSAAVLAGEKGPRAVAAGLTTRQATAY